MAAATHTSALRPFLRIFWLAGAALAVLVFGAARSRAAEPAADQSLFISVGTPITSTEFGRVQRLTEEARRRYQEAAAKDPAGKPRRLKVVYDFNPDNQQSSSPLYGPCQDLAAYIRGLPGDVNTIAFVHKDVMRHSVLPVLACQEIVMSGADGVRLGNVADDADQLPRDVDAFYKDYRVQYYKDLAEQRGRSPAVVLKMLDKNMAVVEGTRADGSTCFVDPRRAKEQGATAVGKDPVVPAGTPGFYPAGQAKRLGLCNAVLESRRDLKDWYEMPDGSLRSDPLEGRMPKAFRVVVGGQFTAPMEEQIKRRLQRSIGQGANFLILQLECGGGDPVIARRLADFIADLKDNSGQNPVKTVAYVTEQAGDYALFPALACHDIVLDKKAKLGDFERVLGQPNEQGQPPNAKLLGESLASLATRRDYPELLVRGMVDRDPTILKVHNKTNPSERRYIEEDRLDRAKWDVDAEVKRKGDLLVLDAARAKDLGLSRHTTENVGELYPVYGLEESKVRLVGPDWFEEFAGFLRKPIMSFILVLLGVTCLFLEVKLPGIGLPGIVAALCFVLFFWAHAQLAFTWLALLLFLFGLVLIAVEIFILPGVGVVGVSGILMVLAGLGLATMERWPQTESEWVDSASNVGRFGLALVGAVLAAIVAARYLPSIPYANRLVLVPPSDLEGQIGEESAGAVSPYAGLLGAIGVAATTLRPSGMVRFGEEYVDVVAEGSYVEAGARVQVIEIEGNRVVVKEV